MSALRQERSIINSVWVRSRPLDRYIGRLAEPEKVAAILVVDGGYLAQIVLTPICIKRAWCTSLLGLNQGNVVAAKARSLCLWKSYSGGVASYRYVIIPHPEGIGQRGCAAEAIQLLPTREVTEFALCALGSRENLRASEHRPLMESEPMNPLSFGFQDQYARPGLRRVDIKLGALPR
jgi:hypothetical protein